MASREVRLPKVTISRKEPQLQMRLSDGDCARLDALISTLNRTIRRAGAPVYTQTDAMRSVLNKVVEQTAATEQAAPA